MKLILIIKNLYITLTSDHVLHVFISVHIYNTRRLTVAPEFCVHANNEYNNTSQCPVKIFHIKLRRTSHQQNRTMSHHPS